MTREISLNTIKIGGESDGKNRKLEIPIELENTWEDVSKDGNSVYEYRVVKQMENSTAQIEYNYQNKVQLFGSLQGPTESKFASKSDASRTWIEVTLKGTSNIADGNDATDFKKLKYDIKSVLEQLVQTIAYPKTLLTFNLNVVQISDDSQLFPACVNCCIILLNQAGINQKQAPFAAMTLKLDDNQIEIVCDQNLQILHL